MNGFQGTEPRVSSRNLSLKTRHSRLDLESKLIHKDWIPGSSPRMTRLGRVLSSDQDDLTLLIYYANVNVNHSQKQTHKHMSIFRRRIQFSTPDPLGNGLGDDIAAERREPEAIMSLEDTQASDLETFWSEVVKDVEKDKDWFTFSED
jgi:hypothetical protein